MTFLLSYLLSSAILIGFGGAVLRYHEKRTAMKLLMGTKPSRLKMLIGNKEDG